MSQHDFEIANQGFPSFRSDLNSGLQALASNSAGATEPSTTYAYQFWYDSTANLLKMRNADDDAWITLAYFDQTNDEWEVRSAVIQAVDSAGVVIKTDDGTTRIEVQDDGDVSINSGQLFVDQSTGNVGIGTSSPTFAAGGGLQVEASSFACVRVTETGNTGVDFAQGGSGDGYVYVRDNADIIFGTNNTEAMRINSSGNVGIGMTTMTSSFSNGVGFQVNNNGYLQGVRNDGVVCGLARTVGTGNLVHFGYGSTTTNASVVGTISTNGSSTAYNTTSDYRLKENVVDMTGAIDRVKALKPSQFNFIADPDTTVDGFIAHEVQNIVPEAVTGEKDAMRTEQYEVSAALGEIFVPATEDADEQIISSDVERPETLEEGQKWRETTAAVMGEREVPDYQGIDQAKLVPLLTGALQEAIAKIEALEARVQALES